jgi:hypothetical protein
MIETLIGLLGGALAAGVVYYAKKFGAALFIQNYGAVIEKTYEVLDPIAGKLLNQYSGSEFQSAVKLAVARVSDGNLDESDVVEITNYVIAQFSPELAASKVLDLTSEEGRAAVQLMENVKKLHDGATFDELFAIALSAKALI